MLGEFPNNKLQQRRLFLAVLRVCETIFVNSRFYCVNDSSIYINTRFDGTKIEHLLQMQILH